MLVPVAGTSRRAESIVSVLRKLASRGVEIRLLHAGTPSAPALRELKQALPRGLTIRRPLYQLTPRARHPTKPVTAFLCLLTHALRGTLPKLKPIP